MNLLENKNDKTAHNHDKRSFIPFKRSKQTVKYLSGIKRSGIPLRSKMLKKTDVESSVLLIEYPDCIRSASSTTTNASKGACPLALPNPDQNIYELNPEFSL